MNLVDTSGWIEYFFGEPSAAYFTAPVEKTDDLIVPVVCLYEVFKKVNVVADEARALQAVAQMKQGSVVDITEDVALSAALIGLPAALLLIVSAVFIVKYHGFVRDAGRDMWHIMCIYVWWAIIFHIILVQAPREIYMAPLCIAFPIFIGYLVSRFRMRFRSLGIALISIVILYNCYTIVCHFPDKNANRYSALADFLVSKRLHYGFSDYYTGYIAQFETKEKSIISPTLFHPTFCDRWPEDTKQVRNAHDTFYVIDKCEYPEAVLALEEKCKERGMIYKKEDVKGLEVYYDFSSKIYPEEFSNKPVKEEL